MSHDFGLEGWMRFFKKGDSGKAFQVKINIMSQDRVWECFAVVWSCGITVATLLNTSDKIERSLKQ